MFKDIQRVEIELQSSCNRRCAWCPNKDFPRDTESIELDEHVFIRIIKELKDGNFPFQKYRHHNKHVSFNRFSEPMLNIDLLKKRVKQAIEIMPDVLYVVNTNGDYITPENLDGLHIDKLNIMDYDHKGYEYWKEKLTKCGVVFADGGKDEQFLIGFHKNIAKVLVALNWTKHAQLEDRAGHLVKNIEYKGKVLNWKNNKTLRTIPCVEPIHAISIDYNGNVVPCCHFRSDNPAHTKYLFGNVYEDTLSEIFTSETAVAFQERMASDDYRNYPEECKRCQKIRHGHFEGFEKHHPAYGWKGNKWENIWNFMDI